MNRSNTRKTLARLAALLMLLCAAGLSWSQSAKTELIWLGQSSFRLTTPSGKVIVTDPWLRTNPLTPAQYKDLEKLGKVDLSLLSHGHFDHSADASALALLNQARVYGPGDLNQTLTTLKVLPAELLPRMNKSGTVAPFPDAPGFRFTAVHAEHSSAFVWKTPASGQDEVHVGGEPVGFIIETENGVKLWFMGDTGLFGDMKFIAEYYKPDVLLIPIGGNFTMGPVDAAYATREWIRPKFAIPMHYGTNPLAKGTSKEFQDAMGPTSTKVLVLKPGEKVEF